MPSIPGSEPDQPERTGNEPIYDPTIPGNNLGSTSEDKEWVPADALDNFVSERTVHKDETNKETARRLINENVPLVAQSIIHLAIHSKSERTRLDAGKYLMDRSLGKPGENTGDASPLENFLTEITEFANSHSEIGPHSTANVTNTITPKNSEAGDANES